MAVIIDEMDVMVEPPPQPGGGERGVASDQETQASPPLGPADVESILRHAAERMARVCAH